MSYNEASTSTQVMVWVILIGVPALFIALIVAYARIFNKARREGRIVKAGVVTLVFAAIIHRITSGGN